MNKDSSAERDNLAEIWGPAGQSEAMRQVADLCQKLLSMDIDVAPDGSSFGTTRDSGKNRSGILAISGRLRDDSIIIVRMELVRGHDNIRVSSGPFFRQLAELGNKIRLCHPHEEENGEVSLSVEIDVKAAPMSMTRESALLSEIKRIDELSRTLQSELPRKEDDTEITNLYKKTADVLAPVYPLPEDVAKTFPSFIEWAEEIVDLYSGSLNIAVSSPFQILNEFAIAAISSAIKDKGETIGILKTPAIPVKGIPELAQKAPGKVVIPAMSINLGSNIYEIGNEVGALLAGLSSMHRPVIFTGTTEQLQGIFHGGQGSVTDPLSPVVRHVPEVPFDVLCRFAVASVGRNAGGLSQRTEDELFEKTAAELEVLGRDEQMRILSVIAKRNVYQWSKGHSKTGPSTSFASRISGFTETLAGLSPRPRVARIPLVQERFTTVLTDTGLLDYFQENLLAQDYALEQLVSRLSMEILTRPLHQPLRYCAQGTPATGKSESAVLLAKKLDIPYMNIDAASMPDYHTAASQLLGSGRGIVMSYQAGRLEQAAKHHTGVVIEVSDLDHASPSVRSMLADLFLQVLETGEAQSAQGAMFSCANIIFAFTMNLPDGIDEGVRKGIGFNNAPSHEDVQKRVISEIKMMLSGAFLSRVGTPVLFEPLDGEALALIVERAIRSALVSAAGRLGIKADEIVLESGLGPRVIASMKTNILSFGARAVLEYGRSLAADALMEFSRGDDVKEVKSLFVSATDDGKIVINIYK